MKLPDDSRKWPGAQDCCLFCWGAQLSPILCNTMDSSPPGSSVHGVLQARILEWVAIYFSRLLHCWLSNDEGLFISVFTWEHNLPFSTLIKSMLMVHSICWKWPNSSMGFNVYLWDLQNWVLVLLLVSLSWQIALHLCMSVSFSLSDHFVVIFSVFIKRLSKGSHESYCIFYKAQGVVP